MNTLLTVSLNNRELTRLYPAIKDLTYPWNDRPSTVVTNDAIELYVSRCEQQVTGASPSWLHEVLNAMKTGSPIAPGALLIKNSITDPVLPRTPPSGRRSDYSMPTTYVENWMTGLSAMIGHVIGHHEEKEENFIHDICPVPTNKPLSNEGATDFGLHTENASFDHRERALILSCLRADHEGIGGTVVSDIRNALTNLKSSDITVLREPLYEIRKPYILDNSRVKVYSQPVSILSGPEESPTLRVTFYEGGTRPLSREARRAFHRLHAALKDCAQIIYLRERDTLVLHNGWTCHGRTAFTPQYDGFDRWLKRTYIMDTLWPVRNLTSSKTRILKRTSEAG